MELESKDLMIEQLNSQLKSSHSSNTPANSIDLQISGGHFFCTYCQCVAWGFVFLHANRPSPLSENCRGFPTFKPQKIRNFRFFSTQQNIFY